MCSSSSIERLLSAETNSGSLRGVAWYLSAGRPGCPRSWRAVMKPADRSALRCCRTALEEISRVDVYDFALQFEHRTFKKGGIGVAYKLLRFDIDYEGRFVSGDLVYSLDGIEVFLRFWA